MRAQSPRAQSAATSRRPGSNARGPLSIWPANAYLALSRILWLQEFRDHALAHAERNVEGSRLASTGSVLREGPTHQARRAG
jgi:hypothetical protein